MQARVGIGVVKPGKMHELMERLSTSLYPSYAEASGFAGSLLLRNAETGKVMSITLWDTDADLTAAESTTDAQRLDLADLFAAQRLRESYEVNEIRMSAPV